MRNALQAVVGRGSSNREVGLIYCHIDVYFICLK